MRRSVSASRLSMPCAPYPRLTLCGWLLCTCQDVRVQSHVPGMVRNMRVERHREDHSMLPLFRARQMAKVHTLALKRAPPTPFGSSYSSLTEQALEGGHSARIGREVSSLVASVQCTLVDTQTHTLVSSNTGYEHRPGVNHAMWRPWSLSCATSSAGPIRSARGWRTAHAKRSLPRLSDLRRIVGAAVRFSRVPVFALPLGCGPHCVAASSLQLLLPAGGERRAYSMRCCAVSVSTGSLLSARCLCRALKLVREITLSFVLILTWFVSTFGVS